MKTFCKTTVINPNKRYKKQRLHTKLNLAKQAQLQRIKRGNENEALMQKSYLNSISLWHNISQIWKMKDLK